MGRGKSRHSFSAGNIPLLTHSSVRGVVKSGLKPKRKFGSIQYTPPGVSKVSARSVRPAHQLLTTFPESSQVMRPDYPGQWKSFGIRLLPSQQTLQFARDIIGLLILLYFFIFFYFSGARP